MYGTLLSSTQIQATLVTLTKSFQDIYFHWSQIQPVYVYMEHCFPIHVFKPRLPFTRTSRLHWSVQKNMYTVASEKTGRSTKARSFWLEAVWLIELASSDTMESAQGFSIWYKANWVGHEKRKAIEVITSHWDNSKQISLVVKGGHEPEISATTKSIALKT